MNDHRRNQLAVIAMGLACVVLLALALGTRDTRHVTDDLTTEVDMLGTYLRSGRESRIEFQARETFLLCSRDLVKTVIPARRAEVAEACTGYETMADALATERSKQEQATN